MLVGSNLVATDWGGGGGCHCYSATFPTLLLHYCVCDDEAAGEERIPMTYACINFGIATTISLEHRTVLLVFSYHRSDFWGVESTF